MKGLNRKDTRTLGYFSFGVAMMCLLVQAWSEGISGWLNLALACFAM